MHFKGSNSKYVGEWAKGQITGSGRYYFGNCHRKIYTGQLYNGDMNGYGVLRNGPVLFKGEFQNGVFHGFGQSCDSSNGGSFKGFFVEGNKSGFGHLIVKRKGN